MRQVAGPHAPFQVGGVGRAEVVAARGVLIALGAQERVDAEGRTIAERGQLAVRIPAEGAVQDAPGGPEPPFPHLHVRHQAMGLLARRAGRDGGARAVFVGGDHGLQQIDRQQAAAQVRIAGDLAPRQQRQQRASLLGAHQDERPALAEAGQIGLEGRLHIVIGEAAGLQGVLPERGHGVDAGLAIARREDPSDAGEGSGVIGQHGGGQLARGAGIVDRPVPLLAAIVGGRVHEEDVDRPVRKRRMGRIGGQ